MKMSTEEYGAFNMSWKTSKSIQMLFQSSLQNKKKKKKKKEKKKKKREKKKIVNRIMLMSLLSDVHFVFTHKCRVDSSIVSSTLTIWMSSFQ